VSAGTTTATRADPAAIYGLASGVLVIDRGVGGLQIGTDPPRSFLLPAPPPGSVRLITALDGTTTLGDVLRAQKADPQIWLEMIGALVEVGLVGRLPAHRPVVRFAAERASLAHRFGPATADRVLAARQDSVVVVVGSTRLAIDVAALLAGSGIGHVHHRPHRALQPTDLPRAAGRSPATWTAGRSRATAADADLLARLLRQHDPQVRTEPPAGQTRADLHVLAVDGPVDPTDAATLATAGLAHLQIWAGPARGVVGPLVLPGRSTCLHCADLHRADADPHAATVARARRSLRLSPALHLLAAVTGGAVAQALQLLDGVGRPETIDGSLEWDPTGRIRRRGWQPHPQCGCGAAAGAGPLTQ
jgi:hypothetical protein